jgi:sugar lactone lactonase YvrE
MVQPEILLAVRLRLWQAMVVFLRREMMMHSRRFYVGVSFVTLVIVLGVLQYKLQTTVSADGTQIGVYEVDRGWPKPLPNNWVLGSSVGLGVDSHDHIWMVHRGKGSIDQKLGSMMQYAPRGGGAPEHAFSQICCTEAPPVLEFDVDGNLLGHWGGPGAGYEWPPSMHGITVDGKDNVWLAGNAGNGHSVLKFSNTGKFLMQVGKNGASKGNKDTENFNKPTEVSVDDAASEVYVADGYGNRRVIVIDANTGKFKRMWGAYGKPPVDQADVPYDASKPMADYQYFQVVHCATLARDGQVYVCDRNHNRVQVFKKDGTYVKETQIARQTFGDGATFDIDLSKDKAQNLMYIADGANHRIWQLLREPLVVENHIGNGGRYPGQFYAIHNVKLDSKGNIYTVETYSGARVQKFIYKGLGPAPATPEGPHNN